MKSVSKTIVVVFALAILTGFLTGCKATATAGISRAIVEVESAQAKFVEVETVARDAVASAPVETKAKPVDPSAWREFSRRSIDSFTRIESLAKSGQRTTVALVDGLKDAKAASVKQDEKIEAYKDDWLGPRAKFWLGIFGAAIVVGIVLRLLSQAGFINGWLGTALAWASTAIFGVLTLGVSLIQRLFDVRWFNRVKPAREAEGAKDAAN